MSMFDQARTEFGRSLFLRNFGANFKNLTLSLAVPLPAVSPVRFDKHLDFMK